MQASYSQKFMHGAGTGVFINLSPFIKPAIPTVLTYSPRVNFLETSTLSVSIGVPFSIGFGTTYYTNYYSLNGLSIENTTTYVINIPAMVNLNIGAGSSKQAEKRFGFFVGGGVAYQYGRYVLDEYDGVTNEYPKVKETSIGPAGTIGLRFAVGKHQKNIEAKFSYMRSLKEDKISALGIVALFNF
ncbi:MAG: hypothetical protein IT249_18840 [Chitinophagaceae bacterium]|nr:hypothetical protein [Chitinophagaceae bacterium]